MESRSALEDGGDGQVAANEEPDRGQGAGGVVSVVSVVSVGR